MPESSAVPSHTEDQHQANEERAELVTYHVKEACVYLPLPPLTSYGHRAELWDVDHWFKEVRLRVVSAGDELFIRLEDKDTGELFAECPLPSDGSPLTRAVEPVVDSSRYYVLRVVDRDDPKKHAFIGLGFRERHESSAFSAALDDYRQYLRRRSEAEAMRAAHEQQREESGSKTEGDGSTVGSTSSNKFALPAGQTISIKLPQRLSASSGESDAGRHITRGFSLNETIAGVLLAPPPPAPITTAALTARQPSGAATALHDWAKFTEVLPVSVQQPQQGQQLVGSTLMRRVSGSLDDVPRESKDSGAQSKVVVDEDQWGDFQ